MPVPRKCLSGNIPNTSRHRLLTPSCPSTQPRDHLEPKCHQARRDRCIIPAPTERYRVRPAIVLPGPGEVFRTTRERSAIFAIPDTFSDHKWSSIQPTKALAAKYKTHSGRNRTTVHKGRNLFCSSKSPLRRNATIAPTVHGGLGTRFYAFRLTESCTLS